MPELNDALAKDASAARNLAPDSAARAEEKDYKKEIVKEIGRGLKYIIKTGWVLAIFALLVRGYHLLAPTKWYWLSQDQIQSLDTILFSGLLGGAIGKYLDKMRQ